MGVAEVAGLFGIEVEGGNGDEGWEESEEECVVILGFGRRDSWKARQMWFDANFEPERCKDICT